MIFHFGLTVTLISGAIILTLFLSELAYFLSTDVSRRPRPAALERSKYLAGSL